MMPASLDSIQTSHIVETQHSTNTPTHLSRMERDAIASEKWCSEDQAPWSAREAATCTSTRAYYIKGKDGDARTLLPGYDSGVMSLIIVVFLFIIVNLRHYSTFLKSFRNKLFSIREQENAFDEKNTVSELRILLSLIILTCLCEGIFIFAYINLEGIETPPFASIGLLTLVCGLYYVWQLLVYTLVGNTFTSHKRAVMWLKGFNASQSLLGILLVIPAMIALFNPSQWLTLCTIAAILYILTRTIFIIKGFRIFYDNSLGLIYFILYLCSLEIIPLIWLYKASISLLQYI